SWRSTARSNSLADCGGVYCLADMPSIKRRLRLAERSPLRGAVKAITVPLEEPLKQSIGETHATLHHASNALDRRTPQRDCASADQEPVRDGRVRVFPQIGGQGLHADRRATCAEEL